MRKSKKKFLYINLLRQVIGVILNTLKFRDKRHSLIYFFSIFKRVYRFMANINPYNQKNKGNCVTDISLLQNGLL